MQNWVISGKGQDTHQPGTVEANSHLSEVGLTAKPAGQRCRRGYPPTQSQYLTQDFSMKTRPFGVSLQIAVVVEVGEERINC